VGDAEVGITNNGQQFMTKAECAKPKYSQKVKNYFTSEDPVERNYAKNICYTECEVRKECVVYALENSQIWWVWGGRDENEIRRVLSVNAEGNEIRRGRYPQCPYCSARTSKLSTKIVDLPEGGRWTTAKAVVCGECGTEWKSRSSANAVNAYHAQRAIKKERLANKKKAPSRKRKPSSISAASSEEQPRQHSDSAES
jgi:hypothetical protein